jgi:uncharacterized protein DUF5666
MKIRSKALLWLAALAAGAAAAGCGSSSPSTSSMTAPPAPVARGATIEGTVNPSTGVASAGGVRASSLTGGIRVTVTGTSLVATTDGSGKFVLAGVPSGRAELHFEAPGVDARLEIDGLVEGQTLTITVHLSESGASVDKPGEGHDDADLKGVVESVTPPSLRVAGRTVLTDSATKIRDGKNAPIALSGVHPGDVVEVEGTSRADGSILASQVKVEDGNEGEDEGEVEVKGPIQSKGASSLTVASRSFVVDGSTRILDHKDKPLLFSALNVGDRVEVEGRTQSGGTLVARKIERED